MTRPSISVVFPVYNEVEILEEGLRRLVQFLERRDLAAFEVLIVESGSTDGTSALADRMAGALPNVRVIHEERRNGFGAAIRLGYRNARMEWVWLMTPDLPFPLESLEHALSFNLDEYDAVLSYRINRWQSPRRRLQSWVFNSIARLLFGLRVRCVNSAFKLIRTSMVRDMEFRSRGWTFETELVWNLERRRARLAEIPIKLIEREGGVSKVGPGEPFRVVADLLRLRFGGK
jgi:glycosyltransferase involved in cell wall biosynthesis